VNGNCGLNDFTVTVSDFAYIDNSLNPVVELKLSSCNSQSRSMEEIKKGLNV
jgi:hypothetical protein